MSVDITSDAERQGEEDGGELARGWGPRLRLVLRILGILVAAALMLVLLGLLFSPRYWRF